MMKTLLTSSSMLVELLPCPHCGGESYCRRAVVNDDVMYAVFCMVCDSSSAYYDVKDSAVESWNKRVINLGQVPTSLAHE